MKLPAKIPARQERDLETLAGLSTDARRRKFLAAHRALVRPEIVTRLTETVHAQVRVDSGKALALAESAVAIARALRRKDSLARSLRAKANALYALGQNKEALEFHAQALRLFEAAGLDLEIGITLSGSLQPLILLGEYDPALAASERARAIFSALGEARRLARLDINVGNIFHRQDRFEEALACYERAYERLSSSEDKEAVAAVLSNLAVCLISLNDFPRALETYQRAREFCERNGMPRLTAQADYNIAFLYYLRGEYSRAIQMLLTTREACNKTGDTYHFALCHLDLSEIYLELNLSAEAAETAHEGHRLFLTLGTGYEAAKCQADEAIALGQQGKTFRAIELFTEARKKFVEEKNLVWPWLIDLYEALLLCEQGRAFEARRLCQKARGFFASSTLTGKAVLCELLLARIAMQAGDLTAAEKDCRAALQRLQPLETPALVFQAHALMGQIERAQNKSKAALESFRAAREAMETLRNSLRGEELKIAFLKNKLEVYEALVEISLEGGSDARALQQAFGFIEEAKSRTLTDLLLQRGQIGEPEGEGKSPLVRQIRELREELNWYYHRIDIEQLRPEERSPERVEKLRREAHSREQEFLRAFREMQQNEGGALAASHKVSLEAISAAVPEDASLLEYFTSGDRVLACVLHGGKLRIQAVTLVSRVLQLSKLLQFQISKFRLGEEYVARFEESLREATHAHLRQLYDELVAPVRDALRGGHLIVVPHGPLHYLPFHALHDGSAYLTDSFSISYAPSASLFALCQNKPAAGGRGALVLGVPDRNAPAILEEVRAVAVALPLSEIYVGPAATLEILRQRGPHARFVHIATHGEFRHDSPLFSGIRLGDVRLNLHDLYQLSLPAELVTLSGCATGMNAVAAGDELQGLVRGLLCAGAHTLLLSLWDVHDTTTAEFMQAFYGRLTAGESKPEALRKGMLEIRAKRPHPFYWAPFVMVGKLL